MMMRVATQEIAMSPSHRFNSIVADTSLGNLDLLPPLSQPPKDESPSLTALVRCFKECPMLRLVAQIPLLLALLLFSFTPSNGQPGGDRKAGQPAPGVKTDDGVAKPVVVALKRRDEATDEELRKQLI